jgi:hypothetical protein
MTEADWLTADNPAYLMRQVHSRPWRKRCLLICACWATVRDLLVSDHNRYALRRLERFAEAEPPHDTFESVVEIYYGIDVEETERVWRAPFSRDSGRLRLKAAELVVAAAGDDDGEAHEEWHRIGGELKATSQPAAVAWTQLGSGLCDLVRCVFGNPYRPVAAIAPPWLAWGDGTVPKLAESAYAERTLPEGALDPARLALVADALEDAGCTDADLLGHLRGLGPHVRGCWALDLLLGKS